MHYASIIEAIADRLPESEALVHHGSIRHSWAAYDQRAARLASALGPPASDRARRWRCFSTTARNTWRHSSPH